MADRDKFLKLVDVIQRKRDGEFEKHNTLNLMIVIIQPVEGYSTMTRKEAEELGYFKVDSK